MALRLYKIRPKGGRVCPHCPWAAGTVAPMDSDWSGYLRWPSRGESWSPWAWLLLVPKLALAGAAWVVGTVLILAAVFAPAAATALLVDTVSLPTVPAVAAVGAVFLATLYFAADLLDL